MPATYHFEQQTGPKTKLALDAVEDEKGDLTFFLQHQPRWNVDITIPRDSLFDFFAALAPVAQAVFEERMAQQQRETENLAAATDAQQPESDPAVAQVFDLETVLGMVARTVGFTDADRQRLVDTIKRGMSEIKSARADLAAIKTDLAEMRADLRRTREWADLVKHARAGGADAIPTSAFGEVYQVPKLKDEEQKREQIRALAAQGLSRRAIAEKVGCSVPFVQSTLKPKESAPAAQEPAGEPAGAAQTGEAFDVDTTPPPTKPARPKPAQPAPAPPQNRPVRLLL